MINRKCTNETVIKGIKIPEDMLVSVDVLSINNDIDIWGPIDPSEFNPLRFSPEIKRNPMVFLGFGLGPRNCIGMKFALIELKLSLVNLTKKFQVLPSVDLPEKLDFVEGNQSFLTYNLIIRELILFEFIKGIVRTPKQAINVIFKLK